MDETVASGSLTRRGSARRVSRPAGPRMRDRPGSALPARNASTDFRDSSITLINRPEATCEPSPPKQAVAQEPLPIEPNSPGFMNTNPAPPYDHTPRPIPVVSIPPMPHVSFEPSPIPWKGLPLDAAVWTFESQDLQEIVSRAIRASAREHSVRLLRLEVLDQILPAEFEKLETQQLMARARYKYLTEQRQGLLQELLSTATAYSRDDHYVIFTDLIIRLSEIAGACDQTLSDLSQIADRTSQIQKLIDVHGTSALAIALRKLNKSYGARSSALAQSKTKIAGLEAALDDAWKEAGRLAKELDAREQDDQTETDGSSLNDEPKNAEDTFGNPRFDMETGSLLLDDETGIIEMAEVVSIPAHTRSQSENSLGRKSVKFSSAAHPAVLFSPSVVPQRSSRSLQSDQTPSLSTHPLDRPSLSPSPLRLHKPSVSVSALDGLRPAFQTHTSGPSNGSGSQNFASPSPSIRPLVEQLGTVFPTDHPMRPSMETRPSSFMHNIAGETQRKAKDADTISVHTVKSVKSSRNKAGPSDHVSQVEAAKRRSLRSSLGSLRLPPKLTVVNEPPVPQLPHTLTRLQREKNQLRRASTATSTVSELNSHSFINFDMDGVEGPMAFHKPSHSSLGDSTDASLLNVPAGVTVDDIHVTPRTPRDEIQEIPRNPPRLSVDDVVMRRAHTKTETGNVIPSIWMHADAPKPSPAERVQSLLHNQSRTKTSSSYTKLKSLTKRYSFGTIPLLTRRSTSTTKVSSSIPESSSYYY